MTTRNRNPNTLAHWLREGVFVLEAGAVQARPDAHDVPMMTRLLTEATCEIARLTGIHRKRFTTNLVADRVFYDGPGDLLALAGPHPVTIHAGGGVVVRPEPRAWTDLIERWGDLSNPNGLHGPVEFAWDESGTDSDDGDLRRLAIFPPSEASVTSGLHVDYDAHPGVLTTVIESEDDSLTATVTNGSETITLSGSTSETVRAGMAFGVKASASAMPATWYRVREVSGATLTVSGGYEGTSGSGKLFTISDCSRLEWRRPHLIGSAPLYFAYARLLQSSDWVASQTMQARFDEEVARIKERLKEETLIQPLPPRRGNAFGAMAFRRNG